VSIPLSNLFLIPCYSVSLRSCLSAGKKNVAGRLFRQSREKGELLGMNFLPTGYSMIETIEEVFGEDSTLGNSVD
jgi:hypothetical protein